MPNRQKHRGKHPKDKSLFGGKNIPKLKEAAADMSYLLSRGYSENLAVKIVVPRYSLTSRQKNAILRVSCSDAMKMEIQKNEVTQPSMIGETPCVDAFNLIITVEAILSGGLIFKCRDGCYRDIASVHGTYRKVQESHDAMVLVGKELNHLNIEKAIWLIDAPVSNSQKFKGHLDHVALENNYDWKFELIHNPDKELLKRNHIVISSDGGVIKDAARWFNLGKILVNKHCLPENLIDLLE